MFLIALLTLVFSGYIVVVGSGVQSDDVMYLGGSTGVMLASLAMFKLSQKKESIGLWKFVD